MPDCPACQTSGADILLSKVFCPNKQCRHYDKEQASRLESKSKGAIDRFIRNMRDPKSHKTDSDITPVWIPDLFDHERDD